MKRFEHILVYTHDSSSWNCAVSWCEAISRAASPKQIDFLYYEEDILAEYPAVNLEKDSKDSKKEELKTLLEERLPEVKTKITKETVNPLKSALHQLSQGTYDLVIVPTNDAESINLSERLARKSPVGVLIVPEKCRPEIKRILLAIDFSNISKLALGWCEAFATLSENETTLDALHVMKMPDASRANIMMQRRDLHTHIYQTSKTALKDFIADHSESPEKWNMRVSEHHYPSTKILEESDRQESDLIVIGTHGRSALSVALLGGQTAEMIRKTKRPLLVVKQKNASLDFLRKLIGFG